MSPRSKANRHSAMNKQTTQTRCTSSTTRSHGNGVFSKNGDQFHLFFKNAHDAMFVADPKTQRLLDANRSAVRLMGYPRTKILTMKADELHPEEIRKKTMEGFKRQAGGSTEELESLVITSRGKIIPVAIRTSAIHVDGRSYLLGIFRNMIDQKKKEHKLKQSERRSAALGKASMRLLRLTDPVKRYNYLLDDAREITGSRYGFLGYIDPETGYLISPTLTKDVWDECQMVHKDIEFVSFTGLWGWVLTHKKSLLCNEPAKDPRSSPAPEGHVKIENFLGVPCLHKSKVVGMIALANKDDGFTIEDQEVIAEYGQLVTMAILDHRKILEKERIDKILEKSRKLQQNLMKISRRLPLCKNITEAWDAAAGPIAKTIGARGSSFLIPAQDDKYFRMVGNYGLSDDFIRQVNDDLKLPITIETVAGRAFLTSNVAFCCNIEADSRLNKWWGLFNIAGYRSIIAMPLLTEDRCLGVAVFYYEEVRSFRKQEIDLIQLAINQLTPALARIEYDRRIQDSEELFRTYFELGLVGMAVTSLEKKWLYVNDRLCEIFGYPRDELLKKTWVELTYPEDVEADVAQFNRLVAGEVDGYSKDKRFIRKDGTIIHATIHATAARNKYGSIQHFIAHIQDITERVRAGEHLRREKEFSENLIKCSVDGILAYDHECRYTLWNEGMERISGVSKEKVLGHKAFEVFPFLKDTGEDQFMLDPISGETVYAKERRYVIPETGKQGFFESNYSPLFDEKGDVIGGLGIIREITERKRAEDALLEEKEKAQKYLDVAGVMFVVINTAQEVSLINRKGCELLGFSEEEIVGKNWFHTFLPERIRKDVQAGFEKLMSGNLEIFEYNENPVLIQGGGERFIAWHNSLLRDAAGKIIGTISSGEDITERRRAELALRSSHERMVTVLNSLNAIVYVTDMRTHEVLFVNEYTQKIFGDVVGKVCWQAFQEGQRGPCDFCTNDKLVDQNGASTGPYVWEFQNTMNQRWYAIHDQAITWIDGRLVRMEIATDITERKETEQALRESEEKYRMIFEHSPLGVFHFNQDGVVTASNERFIEIIGTTRDQLIGFNTMNSLRDESMKRAVVAALSGERGHFEGDYVTVHGGRHLSIKADFSPIVSEEGSLLGGIGVFENITERKKAQEALRHSESRYRTLFETAGDAIFLCEMSGEWVGFIDFNHAAEEVFGCTAEELMGKSPVDFSPPVQPDGRNSSEMVSEKLQQTLAEGPQSYNWEHCRLDKTPFEAEVTLNSFELGGEKYLLGIVRDITERKRLELELSRAQRLEAAGRVAGQIAHDFNNLLSPLMAYPDLMRMQCRDKDYRLMPLLDQMQNAAIQMSEINQQLLTLGRRGHYSIETIYLNALLEKLLASISFPETVEMIYTLDRGMSILEMAAGFFAYWT